jgi:hypothetical protein
VLRPPATVLDLFAVPDDVEPLPGGQGHSVRAGDLVLSPGRDAATAAWLNPVLARLAVRLDEDPARRTRDLRVAMPVPARDGSWVVDGWGASRYEPGTVACRDLDVTLAAGRLLHARLASAVPERPAALDERDDRWSRAERLVFGPPEALIDAEVPDVVAVAAARFDDTDLGPDQLVHGDLAGNVLLDERGAPVVIDVAPAWRPVRWAEAVCVLDGVIDHDAPHSVLAAWTTGAPRQAMLRAIAFRVLSDLEPNPRYAEVLALT